MSFLGGFARTLGNSLIKDQDSDRELSRAAQMEELRKKYADELVSPDMTKVEGEEEVFYNARGKELYRRKLSANELAENKAKLDKTTAEGRRAVAEADVASKEATYFDEDRNLSLEDKKLQRQLQQAQVAQGWSRIGLDRERLDYDREEKKDLKAYEVIELLNEADGEGDSSAAALSERYEMRLDAAKDQDERDKIIAEYRGIARNLLTKIKQRNAIEQRQVSSGGLDLPPPPMPGN